jgi:hypothetical protein
VRFRANLRRQLFRSVVWLSPLIQAPNLTTMDERKTNLMKLLYIFIVAVGDVEKRCTVSLISSLTTMFDVTLWYPYRKITLVRHQIQIYQ